MGRLVCSPHNYFRFRLKYIWEIYPITLVVLFLIGLGIQLLMSKKILIKILGTIFLLLTGAVVSGVIYFFFLLMLSSNKDDFAKKLKYP